MDKIILLLESARHFQLENGKLTIGRFPDGEISMVLKTDVSGREVTLIGSTQPPAENLMELLFALDLIAEKGASKITCFLPYLGYSKSDREKVPGQTVSSRVTAKLFETVGGDKLNVIALDVHSSEVESYFKVPLKNISMMGPLAERFKNIDNLSIVSPDEGGVKRAKEFAGFLDKEVVTINKKRLSDNEVKILEVSGDVSGKNVVIVDDMVQSGGTILEAAKALREKGAKDIFLAVTHMDYPGGGWKKLADDNLIKKIVTTNSIKPVDNLPEKYEIIDIAPILQRLILS